MKLNTQRLHFEKVGLSKAGSRGGPYIRPPDACATRRVLGQLGSSSGPEEVEEEGSGRNDEEAECVTDYSIFIQRSRATHSHISHHNKVLIVIN